MDHCTKQRRLVKDKPIVLSMWPQINGDNSTSGGLISQVYTHVMQSIYRDNIRMTSLTLRELTSDITEESGDSEDIFSNDLMRNLLKGK